MKIFIMFAIALGFVLPVFASEPQNVTCTELGAAKNVCKALQRKY